MVDTHTETLALADAIAVAAARNTGTGVSAVDANLCREIAGYQLRRTNASEIGDLGLVDDLTDRIAQVTAQLSPAAQQALVDGAVTVPDVTPAATTDNDDPDGDVDLSKASHADLDALIADNGLDPSTLIADGEGGQVELGSAKLDAKRAGVAAALAG